MNESMGEESPREDHKTEVPAAEQAYSLDNGSETTELNPQAEADMVFELGRIAVGDESVISTTEIQHKAEVELSTPINNVKKKAENKPDAQTKGHRGHPMKQVKQHLAQAGKLNAKKPMPSEWKKRRRRKNR